MEGVRFFSFFFNGLIKLFPAGFRPVSKHEPCITIGQPLEHAGQNREVWKLKSWQIRLLGVLLVLMKNMTQQ